MHATQSTATISLRSISLGPIRKGGYIIKYDGKVPKGMKLLLGLPDVAHSMDVTSRNSRDLLGPDNLPLFLSLIGKQKLWGTEGRCRLFLVSGGSVVAQSNELTFKCPVRPYVGPLRPELGRGGAGGPLAYTGTPPSYPDGRMLYVPAIDNCYYFAYGGLFETDNTKRGFNCITYAGAVFGVDSRTGAMGANGTRLADHCCHGIECSLEGTSLEGVREFFLKNRVGTYLLWSAHHIVLVVNGVVHEFREKYGRYNCQPISDYRHSDAHWSVRKAPKQF